jgi:prepilin-type N-terminal cleavage/methylation domain-containing protein
MRFPPRAFTLVELMVVVTIIVILIAMLVPAMEKAQYQGNLAICLSNLRTIAGGVVLYAASNQNAYPYRKAMWNGAWRRMNFIYDGFNNPANDERPTYRSYFKLDTLVDPMSGQIGMDAGQIDTDSYGFSNYELWFGVQFPGGSGLFKTSDRLSYGDQVFRVIASDEDKILPGSNNSSTNCAHPDQGGRQYFQRLLNQGDVVFGKYTLSRYLRWGTVGDRGPVDTQHAFTDGSAHRYLAVQWDEYLRTDRMSRVPIDTAATHGLAYWNYIPRN